VLLGRFHVLDYGERFADHLKSALDRLSDLIVLVEHEGLDDDEF